MSVDHCAPKRVDGVALSKHGAARIVRVVLEHTRQCLDFCRRQVLRHAKLGESKFSNWSSSALRPAVTTSEHAHTNKHGHDARNSHFSFNDWRWWLTNALPMDLLEMNNICAIHAMKADNSRGLILIHTLHPRPATSRNTQHGHVRLQRS